MAEQNQLHIITASTTESGAAVYMREDSTWTSQIEEATAFEHGSELDKMLAVAASQERIVCDPYVMDVQREQGGGLQPLSIREEIRSQGPTTPVRRGDAVAVSRDEGR
jgi:hypothetical protein